MAALLTASELRARYGWTRVLHGVSFEVEEGGITTILGANGAGKTTTLRAVSGLVSTEGSVHFAGGRIDGRAPEDLVRAGIAHVPEGRGTFVGLTVEENLRLGAYARRERARSDDFERVYQYFPILRERRRQVAGTLSGGEQQMLAIARALMGHPRLLLLDEPSLGLAPLIARQIFDAIKKLNTDEKLTVFLVEQNAFHALKLAHRGYVMVNGRITLSGTGRALLARPEVKAAYLEGGRH
ncbi:MAG: ABC transporter ATP-binding protein [Candidatus Rokubacteria bacterium 13_1_20CM_4_68_9]|nr:MAG: ABC transporter ATP-binding protein [Candidatus Rokubacteria bacterium 13_1_20CM_4_68_9]